MRYMLTIYSDERRWETASPEDARASMRAYEEFGRQVEEAGALVAGDGLEPTSTATTVRVRDGERLVTDGPFAETKEQLGGFYVLDGPDLDTAIGWAAKIPDAATGSVEVRPVMDYEAFGAQHEVPAAEAGS